MRLDRQKIGVLALVFGVAFVVGSRSASAQGYDGPGSLGGFGGSSAGATAGMVGSGPMIVPYAGNFEGFMPGRMGGGSALSFRPRTGARRGAFRLSPPSGGMSGMSGGILGGRSTSIGSREDMRIGGGMRRTPGGAGSGVMPPSIGYPFRQPPSLVAPSGGVGMSM